MDKKRNTIMRITLNGFASMTTAASMNVNIPKQSSFMEKNHVKRIATIAAIMLITMVNATKSLIFLAYQPVPDNDDENGP